MDFSVLKPDEKIKAFANYTNPSPNKYEDKSSGVFSKDTEAFRSEINFKENNEDCKAKTSSAVDNKLLSYEVNKLLEKSGPAAKPSENLMGEKGSKFNANDVIFKNECEFTNQEICKICETDLSKNLLEKKNCTLCGFTVCKVCSTRKVNEIRVCDLCFLKVKSSASEIRRKDFLNVTLKRKEDLKNNIPQGKNQVSVLEKDIKNHTDKISSDEISYGNTIREMQIKLNQLQEKQKQTNEKLGGIMKNYEKKKEIHKQLQEKTSEKQKDNDSILNNVNTKKQIYLSKFDEFCKLQNHKEELENSDLYKLILKEQEILKSYRDKNKNPENEESKKQKSAKSSIINETINNTYNISYNNNSSYDDRKPSILEERDNVSTPALLGKKSVVTQGNNDFLKRNEEEFFCDNSCAGNLFAYHKQKKQI